MAFRFEIEGMDELRASLDREHPSRKFLQTLDSLLFAAFQATQAMVHIDTHSLRASGKYSSYYNPAMREWEGKITYGGASPGSYHDPVRYAVYEASRNGSHDFMTPAYASEPTFEALIRFDDVFRD